jgi:hypothetical protein
VQFCVLSFVHGRDMFDVTAVGWHFLRVDHRGRELPRLFKATERTFSPKLPRVNGVCSAKWLYLLSFHRPEGSASEPGCNANHSVRLSQSSIRDQ